MNDLRSRALRSLANLLCFAAMLALAASTQANTSLFDAWTGGLADPPHPAKPFFTKGNPVTTTVVADGSDGTAIFTYDNNTTENTGGARGSWRFSTVARQDGPVKINWVYEGDHATKKVYANLEVYVVRNGEYVFTPLVEAGPGDRGIPPSGGFTYSSEAPLVVDVVAGQEYGFRIAGGNSDQESKLYGKLSLTFDIPITANPIADVTAEEDALPFSVDLSDAFSSATDFDLSVDNVSNASLFASYGFEEDGTTLGFTLAENRNGAATVTIRASNTFGVSATNTFNIVIEPVNDAPATTGAAPGDITLQLGVDDTRLLNLGLYFEDVDVETNDDQLTYSASVVGGDAGAIDLQVTEDLLSIQGVAVGTADVRIVATDLAGATASAEFSVTANDPAVFGAANLIHSYPLSGNEVGIAVSATGETGASTQFIELLTSATCEGGTIGADAVVFGQVPVDSFDENGYFFYLQTIAPQAPVSTYAAARLSSGFTNGETSQCIVAGPDNDSWTRALPIASNEAGLSGYLDRPGNARWYKFAISPGARVTVDLSNLPADYDLFLFKDIKLAFQELEGDSDIDGLNRLGAEFAPSIFAPSIFAPSVFAPSIFAPDAYAPSIFAPSIFAPSIFAPSIFAPSIFAPSTYSPSIFAPSIFAPSIFAPSIFAPSIFAPSIFAPSIFAPENFVSAQVRSLLAVAAQAGTGSERVVSDTWNNTGEFYIRVSGKNGAWDIEQPFELSVQVDGVDCEQVLPIAGPDTGVAGGYTSIILWDSARVAGDPENSPAQAAALEANLQALALRPEVNGVIVDLAAFPHIQQLHTQADNNTSCPYAENLTAAAIKDIVDDYRALNPGMEYVVLVGGDNQIPFFRYPDQGLLGPEQDYDPPMANFTQSQSALKLNYVLGQDEYGAALKLSLRDGSLPLPGLAVGRLVETAADMNTVLEAYLSTAGGVVPTPTSTLVTGYDFLTDVALEIQSELVAGTGGVRNDTLITPANVSPDDVSTMPGDGKSWTADQLRVELLEEREDIIFLAGHFSANSALAADYKTTVLTTELAASSLDLTNVLVYSAGCHSAYNIVNQEAVPNVTEPLDWTQAFAQKGATLIAGTGYQYGDTEFIEYGERLYLGFTRELRTGSGPVSVGQALVRAKQDYLQTTPDIRGLHRKTLLISTIFGLPMLSVDMPGERISRPTPAPGVTPTPVNVPPDDVDAPGEVLGLQSADISFDFDGADGPISTETLELKNIDTDPQETLVATYLEGPDGNISYPAEPTLPLVTRDVTATGLSLRGVGFRGGSFRESTVLPLTGAPTTELRGVHTPFTSPVYFPMRLATANYFDTLTGGARTLLHVTPAQHRVVNVGDQNAILRQFDALNYRLFYSDNTQTYGPNRPALASPPTLSGVAGVTDVDDAVFFANVVVDPSAGVHQVWVTYTDDSTCSAGSCQWVSLDLEQDADVSTRWSARLPGGAATPDALRFVVQAVSGTGLVATDDNYGAFYRIGGELGEVGPDGRPFEVLDTELSLLTLTGSGTYGASIPLTATLKSADGDNIIGASVVFTIGGTGRAGITNNLGEVEVNLPLTAVPGDYKVTASFSGNSVYAPASAEQAFSVEKAATALALEFGEQQVDVDGVDPNVVATLTDASGAPILERTVYFTLVTPSGDVITTPVITNNVGQARLGKLLLPESSYELTARFLGVIPSDQGTQELTDPVYLPAQASATLSLVGGNNCPTDIFDEPGNNDPTLAVTGFCYLSFDVRGKAIITDGTLVVGEGVRISKKVDQFGQGSVIVLEGGSIGDKVVEDGPGDVIILGTVENPVTERGPGNLVIEETGSVAGNVDESDSGSLIIRGFTGGNAKESEAGDLVITPTGQVDGNATELGEGSLTNDGLVSGGVSQD